ncbi:GNAT family N-acetyltransferase [Salmonirosea aquatica]|uniref:GNAT family N-acetyltransferase n=1 Tax=Salmonirosea aquatica TaxID=2654236 RepID=A0A7C9BBH3_9BACT|nr:GNAT family N-acetyltransferase [Cytophagaceae bacterium SJW1-29]
MPLHFTTAQTNDDLRQILALQQKNLKTKVSEAVKREQGFVTVCHSWEQINLMHHTTPQIVAKDGDKIAAYALAMLPALGELVPDLQPMFALFAQIPWRGNFLTHSNYYIMGQICVAEEYRGQGTFDGLYQKHREVYRPDFDLLVTEVSTNNTRSMRAHERVGFRTIYTHLDHVDEWNVLAWVF